MSQGGRFRSKICTKSSFYMATVVMGTETLVSLEVLEQKKKTTKKNFNYYGNTFFSSERWDTTGIKHTPSIIFMLVNSSEELRKDER